MITINGIPVFGESLYTIDFNLNKTEYNIDEYISGTGTVYNNGSPLPNALVTMVVESEDGKSIFDVEQYETDSQGNFDVNFKILSSASNKTYYIKLKSNGVEKSVSFRIKDDDGGSDSTPSKTKKSQEKKQTTSQGTATIKTDNKGNITVSLKLDDDKVTKQIKNNANGAISINADIDSKASQVLVNLSTEIIRTATKNKTILEINTGNAKISIEPSTLSIEGEGEISFITKILSQQEADKILDQVDSTEFNPVSLVFDLDMTYSKGKINFNNPLIATIDYDSSKVIEPEKLGGYYFNEVTKEWKYIGGRVIEDGVIQFTVEDFSKYIAMEYRKTFNDISNIAWAKNEIEILAARHIINGVDNKNYAPNNNITRAEFSKLIVEGLKLKSGDKIVSFSDVNAGAWYEDSVKTAASLGIVEGYGGRFDPNAPITREQMATIIVRALQHVESIDTYDNGNVDFVDQSQISSWADETIKIAVNKGLIKGLGNGYFGPKEKATRAQAAVIIYRMLDLLERL